MKGDGWRTRHDTIKPTLDTILIATGLDVTTEVYDLLNILFHFVSGSKADA